MKLNRNLVQISATALVTSAAFIVYMTTFQVRGFTIALLKSELIESERITLGETDTLRTEYMDFRPMMVKYQVDPVVEIIDTLEGFVISAAHLNEIIDSNHSIQHSIQGNPDKVLFLFGKKGTFKDSDLWSTKRANMHIIAVGMKNNVLYTDDTTGEGASIFDKADPCPPNCPE